jgi:hypothetical protein
MILADWEVFYLNADFDDNGDGGAYFYYTKQGNDDKLFYSNSIPEEFDIDRNAYMLVLNDLFDLLRELRKAFLSEGVPAWSTFSMSATSQGKMKAEFGYVDWEKSKYYTSDLMHYFIYKFINKKYVNSKLWTKMDEMAKYENSNK